MSYRFVRVTDLYKEYIKQYYTVFPDVAYKPFSDQYQHIMNDSQDVASSLSKKMQMLGVDALIIFSNAIGLQEQWKKEHNCSLSGQALILEQLSVLKPDVVWLDDMRLITQQWIANLRKRVPTIKMVTGHVCAPYSSENIKNLQGLDFLFTCTPCLRKEFSQFGINTHLLYHSFDSDILKKTTIDNYYPENDLLFTGSLYTGGGFHKTRIEYIDNILENNLPIKIYGSIEQTSKILKKMAAFTIISRLKGIGSGRLLKKMPLLSRFESYGDTPVKLYSRKLKSNLHPPVFGLDQFKLLSKSKICFNIHGEIAKGCAGNLRLFEATGVGSCLITDWKKNITDLFDPENEIVTYKSPEECIERMKWLLENPLETKRIAMAGQKRTLRDHTSENRAKQIHETIQENFRRA